MEDIRQIEAVLVIYDHDWTLTKRHSNGRLEQLYFELPWAANLRVFSALKQHLHLLDQSDSPKVILATATFGEYQERSERSWEALGFDPESILICAEFVDKKKAPLQGKNLHIINLLLEHYRRNPHIKITRVILVDDDYNNIFALDHYLKFLQSSPYCNDQRLNVPVEGLHMEPPVLSVTNKKCDRHIDKHLGVEVCIERPESEWRFLRVLSWLETLLGIKKTLPHFRERRPAKNLLTRSFDEGALIEARKQALSEITNLANSSDSCHGAKSETDNDSCAEADENVFSTDREILFSSMP